MLNQSYVLRVLANEHQNNLLKEADANRTARKVKRDMREQKSVLKRIVNVLGGTANRPYETVSRPEQIPHG